MENGSSERPAGLKFLDRLVGTWKMSGGMGGELTYEWIDGGYFLIARGDMNQQGQRLKHIEIIGYQHPPEAAGPATMLTSRLFTSTGNSLDYTHEVDDETVTSWYGEKGSPTFMKARWSPDGNTLTGEWEWPGGGYAFVLTRISG
jgi:hypothetical protein